AGARTSSVPPDLQTGDRRQRDAAGPGLRIPLHDPGVTLAWLTGRSTAKEHRWSRNPPDARDGRSKGAHNPYASSRPISPGPEGPSPSPSPSSSASSPSSCPSSGGSASSPPSDRSSETAASPSTGSRGSSSSSPSSGACGPCGDVPHRYERNPRHHTV